MRKKPRKPTNRKKTGVVLSAHQVVDLRKAKGWNQTELAQRSEVTPRTAWKAENGQSISIENADQIARALGATLNDLQEVEDKTDTVRVEIDKKPDGSKRVLATLAFSNRDLTDSQLANRVQAALVFVTRMLKQSSIVGILIILASMACALSGSITSRAAYAYVFGVIVSLTAGIFAFRRKQGYRAFWGATLLNIIALLLWPTVVAFTPARHDSYFTVAEWLVSAPPEPNIYNVISLEFPPIISSEGRILNPGDVIQINVDEKRYVYLWEGFVINSPRLKKGWHEITILVNGKELFWLRSVGQTGFLMRGNMEGEGGLTEKKAAELMSDSRPSRFTQLRLQSAGESRKAVLKFQKAPKNP